MLVAFLYVPKSVSHCRMAEIYILNHIFQTRSKWGQAEVILRSFSELWLIKAMVTVLYMLHWFQQLFTVGLQSPTQNYCTIVVQIESCFYCIIISSRALKRTHERRNESTCTVEYFYQPSLRATHKDEH